MFAQFVLILKSDGEKQMFSGWEKDSLFSGIPPSDTVISVSESQLPHQKKGENVICIFLKNKHYI